MGLRPVADRFHRLGNLPPLLPPGATLALPPMARVRQHFHAPVAANPSAALAAEWQRLGLDRRSRPGQRIGIAVGSRGLAALESMVRTLVELVRAAGARPVIIPAMGSHGGATPEGQVEVLRGYGVDPDVLGCEARPEMDVVELGRLENRLPVYCASPATEVDGLVLLNRIKPHTAFRGAVESGLVKMLVIGLGKHLGALTWHRQGMECFGDLLPRAAAITLAKVPLLAGFATVENAYEQVALVRGLLPEELVEGDKELLRQARQLMATILLPRFDVLVVDQMGKDISGDGMDPNVTGRYFTEVRGGPEIQALVALGLTERSHGNANGMGGADVITRRLFDQIDFHKTYVNAITAAVPEVARLPVVAASDREAILLAMRVCKRVEPGRHTAIRIRNTLDLSEIMVSETLLPAVREIAEMEVVREPQPLAVDSGGNLIDWPQWR